MVLRDSVINIIKVGQRSKDFNNNFPYILKEGSVRTKGNRFNLKGFHLILRLYFSKSGPFYKHFPVYIGHRMVLGVRFRNNRSSFSM